MDVLPNYNQTRFLAFVPQIRKNIDEWRILEVSLTGQTQHNAAHIALKLKEQFKDQEGLVFICNSKEILVLLHTGKEIADQALSKNIRENMPNHSCEVQSSGLTADGLLKIQLRLEEIKNDDQQVSTATSLFNIRKSRLENRVMVVDDDAFMRSLISKTFQNKAQVMMFKDAEGILDAYLEHLPDIIFLDIHLQDQSGIETLQEIHNYDESAYAIMITSDSIKENVLEAKKHGAKGFIAKPFTIEKLESIYKKCPTISNIAKSSLSG